MKPLLISVASLLLAGCANATKPEPIIVPTEVLIPVVGSCVPHDFPATPSYPDTRDKLLSASDAAERYLLMGAGWPLRDQRLKALEIVVAGCPKAKDKK